MPNQTTTSQSENGRDKSTRLHYLDWLQVLAILGVFLFHAVHPYVYKCGWTHYERNFQVFRAVQAWWRRHKVSYLHTTSTL